MVLKYQHPFAQIDLADGWGSMAGGRTQPHRGLDYQPGAGAAIPAVAAGVVSANRWNAALGNVLVIAHPDGMYSGYSHLAAASPHQVGAAVVRGEPVGVVGNTGSASSGAHLHLTITFTADGTWNNADIRVTTDPYPFINARLNGEDPVQPLKESDMPKIISVPGGTIALVTETFGTMYTSTSGGQGFSIAANTKAYGQVTGLTQDQVTTLVAEANARGQRIADLVAAAR
ncbi:MULTISPECIES: M23 family metallopeptidase [Plantibacter]|uniref:M23 family metallopeptidase n=1 Tax=Plantibacter TaxID=190323 RepID=UPI00177ECF19|nr:MULTISPECIES: M23 family metallopeptidase [Plantibacter]MBD8467661.1 M23 family metallopeptidase [Plantibacter sp. CFBP 8798]MBD8517609.1 M23 family metallopeptidase [Plantibacter sp. CFBP 8804]MDD9153733.1 M23 family metallopeptidase [Plantibacter flavus]